MEAGGYFLVVDSLASNKLFFGRALLRPALKFVLAGGQSDDTRAHLSYFGTSGGRSGQVVLPLAVHGISQGDRVTVVYAPQRAEPTFVAALSALRGLKIPRCLCNAKSAATASILGAYCLLRLIGPFNVIHGHISKAGALARSLKSSCRNGYFYAAWFLFDDAGRPFCLRHDRTLAVL